MNCKHCGTVLQPGEQFCKMCGKKVGTQENSKLPMIAALCTAVGIFVIIFLLFALLFSKSDTKNADTNQGNRYGMKPEETQTIQPVETTAPTPVPTAQATTSPYPVFTRTEASSYRVSDQDGYGNVYFYNPEYAVDGNFATCWASDSKYGANPSITLRASSPQYVTGVRFSNGYFRTKETYQKNRRITKMRISYQGGSKDVSCGINQYREMQNVIFDTPVETTYLTFQVLDSVDGGWHDVSISEIEVY